MPHSVVIVGAGVSGAILAWRLATSGAPLRVTLVERGPRLARGLAYSTDNPLHVLNVPAGRMSALPEDPDHFVRWLREHGPAASAAGNAFVPRGLYGRYVADLLESAGDAVERVHDEAVGLSLRAEGDGDLNPAPATERAALGSESAAARVSLASGRVLHADRVVLAMGNFPPVRTPGVPEALQDDPRIVRNPWAPGALDAPPAPAADALPTLLLGTGLTMIDVALGIDVAPGIDAAPALRAASDATPLVALSRRGLLPQPHRALEAPPAQHPAPPVQYWPEDARGLLSAVRLYVRACQQRGVDWREAITALRPVTARLWTSMPVPERRRFLEHLQPLWDTHRHRAAPQVWARVEDMLAQGVLRTMAGRIVRVAPLGPDASDPLEVTIAPRAGGELLTLRVARIINCTGPCADITRAHSPLLANLFASGLARPDPLCLGLDARPDGALLNADGDANELLWAIGPLLRGVLWETTAVPEIRTQARDLAAALTQRLAGPRALHAATAAFAATAAATPATGATPGIARPTGMFPGTGAISVVVSTSSRRKA